MVRLKIWHHRQNFFLIGTLPSSLLKKKVPSAKWPKNVVEQYPISFFFVCGAVSFDLVEQYPLDLVEQYPKSISKRPRSYSGQTVVKQ